MPNSPVLNDRVIAQLYSEISRVIDDCARRRVVPNMQSIYDEVYYSFYYSVEGDLSDSILGSLYIQEKIKAFKVLNVFFKARQSTYDPIDFYAPRTKPELSTAEGHFVHYCLPNSLFADWLLIRDISSRKYINNYRPNQSVEDWRRMKILARLLTVTLAAIATGFVFVALFYIFSQTDNHIERIVFNEGWLDAILFHLRLVANAIASLYLTQMFAAAPLLQLAVVLGFTNPFAIVCIGTACLTILGTAAGCFFTEKLQEYLVTEDTEDELEPLDPYRYKLTDAQSEILESKGLDPLKVRCALVLLRAEFGDHPSRARWGLFSRGRNEDEQRALNQIRALRRGDLTHIIINDLTIDCTKDTQEDPVLYSAHSAGYETSTMGTSGAGYVAPPMDPYGTSYVAPPNDPYGTGYLAPPMGTYGTGYAAPPMGPYGAGYAAAPMGPYGAGYVAPSMDPYGTSYAAPPMDPYGTGYVALPMGPYGAGYSAPPMGTYGTGYATPPMGPYGAGSVAPPMTHGASLDSQRSIYSGADNQHGSGYNGSGHPTFFSPASYQVPAYGSTAVPLYNPPTAGCAFPQYGTADS